MAGYAGKREIITMYPAKFDYHRANTVHEAISLLQEHEDAKVLAGGHSLLPAMKLRLAHPTAVIDIGRIGELKSISQSNETITIGALSTHAEIASNELLRDHCTVIAEAASNVGDQQVRNKGTIGGNLAHADPGSDLPAAVLAVGGIIHLSGPGGDRQVNASDFFVDLLMTNLGEHEILTAVEVPVLGDRTGSAYLKFANPASGYAVCGAAAVVSLTEDGQTFESSSLCFNGITATPYQASHVSDWLETDDLLDKIGNIVAKIIAGSAVSDEVIDFVVDHRLTIDDPLGDIHAAGPYRAELAKVFGKRALKAARDRAQN
jgi:carbon-monoxide dehydrogenase medium subunit